MIGRGPVQAIRLIVLAVVLASLALGEGVLAASERARVVVRGPATHRTISLTIDDGWDPERCHEIYDILVGFGIPATWLPNAVHVRQSKALWRRIGARFEIANHTTHHPSLPSLSLQGMRREIVTDFYLDLSFYQSYDSDPPDAAAEKTDYGVITSLGYSF